MTIHQSLRKGLLVKGVMMCLGKRSFYETADRFLITYDYRKFVSSLSLTRWCQNSKNQSRFETLIKERDFGIEARLHLARFEGR